MTRRRMSVLLSLLAVVAIALAGFYVWQSRPPLKTVPVRLGSITFIVSGNGKVAALEQVDVSAKVGGLITELTAKEGDQVTVEQVLARLDDQELQARVRQVGSAAEEARSTIAVAQVQVDQAQNHLTRTQRLFDGGVAPRAELDDARNEVDLRAAQLRTAIAAHRQALASLDYVRTQLNNTVVRAPMTGLVIAKHHERGTVVQPGMALYTLADNARPIVRAEIDESDAGKIQVGMPVVITSDAFPGRKITSTIQKIAWRVGRKRIRSDDPAEISDIKVLEAEIPLEPDAHFRIGMAMDVKINTGTKDKAMLIPRSSVQRRGSDLLVSVVKGKVVEERSVQLGAFEGQVVEVLKGLQPGELVVLAKE
ncbi:MAG TPA: efflux RND transporter periplasmic adaptor subunit [Nitrospirales bacterium]|jgi:RND family efflux transporter MFP subunit